MAITLITRGLGGNTLVTRGLGDLEQDVLIRPRRKGGHGRKKDECNNITLAIALRGAPEHVKKIEVSYRKDPRQLVKATLRESLLRESVDEQPITTFSLNEWKFMTFDVVVHTTQHIDSPSYRLVIRKDDDVGLTIRGVPTVDGVVVRIPPLKGLIDEGTFNATFEIIVDDKIFKPLNIKLAVTKDKNLTN